MRALPWIPDRSASATACRIASSIQSAGRPAPAGTGTATTIPCLAPIRAAAAMICATSAGVSTLTSSGRPELGV